MNAARDAVVRFNLDPFGYAHRTWFDDLPEAVRRLLRARSDDPAVRRAANRWLLDAGRLTDCMEWDFASPHRQHLLRDASTLQGMALTIGVAACRRSLRLQIRSSDAWSPQRILGTERYAKALAFDGLEMSRLPSETSGTPTVDQLFGVGVPLLLATCGEDRRALVRRAAWKFPASLPLALDIKPSARRRDAICNLLGSIF
ncbi:MAG: hypothetical protein ACTHL1_10245 [Burkholderiaceae bacterium]